MSRTQVSTWLPWLTFAVAALLPLAVSSDYVDLLLNQIGIHVMLAVGYYVIYGMTGILSLAQAAFWGIGAYAAAILSVDLHLPVWVGFVAGPAIAACFGVLLGLPTLKLKTHYLTLATIGFAQVVRQVLINWEHVTHGPNGIRGIPAPAVGGFAFDTAGSYYYLILALVLLVVVVVNRVDKSRLGRALAAVRDDEIAAAASGMNVTRLRLLAFALSAAIAGLAGAAYSHSVRYISPEVFQLQFDIVILAMLIIGGRELIYGGIIGAVLVTLLPEVLRPLKDWYLTIYGVMLLLILNYMPQGLLGMLRRSVARLRAH